jgi:hypothetical protein
VAESGVVQQPTDLPAVRDGDQAVRRPQCEQYAYESTCGDEQDDPEEHHHPVREGRQRVAPEASTFLRLREVLGSAT